MNKIHAFVKRALGKPTVWVGLALLLGVNPIVVTQVYTSLEGIRASQNEVLDN